MASKNNNKKQLFMNRKQVPHYSLRKLSIGVASVLLGTTFYLGTSTPVHADVANPSDQVADQSGTNQTAQTKVVLKATQESNTDNEKTGAAKNATPAASTPDSTAAKQIAESKTVINKTATSDVASQTGKTDNVTTNAAKNATPAASTPDNSAAKQIAESKTAVNKTAANDATSTDTDWTKIPDTVKPGDYNANSKNFNPRDYSHDKKNFTTNSTDGRYTINWTIANVGNVGTAPLYDATNNPEADISAQVQAGDVLTFAFPKVPSWGVQAPDLQAGWGSKQEYWKDNIQYVEYHFTKTGTLPTINIKIDASANGYGAKSKDVMDPVGVNPKQIRWFLNGQEQADKDLHLSSITYPDWKPADGLSRSDQNLGVKPGLGNSGQLITYHYRLSETNGTVPLEPNGDLNYPSPVAYDNLNYGTVITIPMPKGFVLDQTKSQGWLSSNIGQHTTIKQDSNGDVVITSTDFDGRQNWNTVWNDASKGYAFFGQYNVEQKDTPYTITADRPVSVVQKIDKDGKWVKYYIGKTPISEKIMAAKDKVPIINVDVGVWHSTNYAFTSKDKKDYVLSYTGIRNNSNFDFNDKQSTLTLSYGDAAVVHAVRVPKIKNIKEFTYTYTLRNGQKVSGTVAAGGLIQVQNPDTDWIKSIDISFDNFNNTDTTDWGAPNTTKIDYENHTVQSGENNTFESYGYYTDHQQDGTALANETSAATNATLTVNKFNYAYYIYNKPQFSLNLTTQIYMATQNDNQAPNHALDGTGNYHDIANIGINPEKTLGNNTTNTHDIKDPIFYFVLPEKLSVDMDSLANFGKYSDGTSADKMPKITVKIVDGRQVIKLDYSGLGDWDVRRNMHFELNGAPDLAAGSYTWYGFVYTPDKNFTIGSNTHYNSKADHGNFGNEFNPAWLDPEVLVDKQLTMLTQPSPYAWDGPNTLKFSMNIGGLNTNGMAQGNTATGLNQAKSKSNLANSNAMLFGVALNNSTLTPIQNVDQIINLPKNFHLTTPVTYGGKDAVNILYGFYNVDLDQGSQDTSHHPDLTNFVTADQITDWSKVKAVAVQFASLPAQTVSGRILLNGIDPQFKQDLGKKVTLQTGFYANGFKPSIAKDAASITITGTFTVNYVDDDGKVIKTNKVIGHNPGDPIPVQIPAGYHVEGGNVPTLTINPEIPVYTVNVIKDKHVTGDPTTDTKDVLNIIRYVDDNGNVVKTDHVTGKAGNPIEVTIPDGYHVDGGNIPKLVISSGHPVQTVNIIKDKHAIDGDPTTIDKDVLNIIKYVDSDGTVVKTQTQTGKAGDQITVQIPDGYHVEGGNVPSLMIDPNHSVQTVNVIKDEHDTDNPTPSDKPVLNIIKYVDSDGTVVKTQTQTGKAGDQITVQIPDGYHVAGGNVPSLTIDPNHSVQTVNVIKDEHETDNPTPSDKPVLNIIRYVDQDGNVVKTDHATGKAGDPITVKIPDGYHVDGGNVPTLKIDPKNPVHTINLIKDQHTDDPTHIDNDVLNIIKYVDEDGNVVKTDHAAGKAGDPIEVAIPAGYHTVDGNVPTLTIDPQNPVHIINIIKDKHDTDNPTPSDKDVNTTIKYVDGNGNVIKTEHVTGKAGDAINLHLPDGYQFKDGQAQTIFITKDGVQIVNIIKLDAALSPDTPNSAASKAANRKALAAASQKQARKGKQSANQLPQTGNKSLAIAGIALLGLASLMGLSGFKKRRD